METKDKAMETKELNLCELLKGHGGETFYSPCYGIVKLITITSIIEIQGVKKHSLTPKGSHHSISDGQCMLYPSRALYEQNPFDPYAAWMKWQEEQKKYALSIAWIGNGIDVANSTIFFRAPADRDKCIEEIKATIKNYNGKI